MEMTILIILSILPGFLILWYFYSKDKYNKEPKKLIAKMFFFSAIITIPLAIVFESIIATFSVAGIIGIFISAFLSAALVEETLKYWMVKKFAFSKPYFDEIIDGIIYAVAASLGFATLENILYIFNPEYNGITTAVVRAFTAVPSHAFDGAILGYFLGLAKFANNKKHQNRLICKGLLIAILFHGLYDFFLFSADLLPVMGLLILPLLIIQSRFVNNAIKQSYFAVPPEMISLNIKELFAGYNFWDYLKLLIGWIFIIIAIMVILGMIISAFDGTLLQEEIEIQVGVFLFALFIGTFSFKILRGLHKKHLQFIKANPQAIK